MVFPMKIITSTGFYRYCAAGASAPVVVKSQSPKFGAGREFRYGGSKTLRKVLGSAHFPHEKGQENDTDGKTLRR